MIGLPRFRRGASRIQAVFNQVQQVEQELQLGIDELSQDIEANDRTVDTLLMQGAFMKNARTQAEAVVGRLQSLLAYPQPENTEGASDAGLS